MLSKGITLTQSNRYILKHLKKTTNPSKLNNNNKKLEKPNKDDSILEIGN